MLIDLFRRKTSNDIELYIIKYSGNAEVVKFFISNPPIDYKWAVLKDSYTTEDRKSAIKTLNELGYYLDGSYNLLNYRWVSFIIGLTIYDFTKGE